MTSRCWIATVWRSCVSSTEKASWEGGEGGEGGPFALSIKHPRLALSAVGLHTFPNQSHHTWDSRVCLITYTWFDCFLEEGSHTLILGMVQKGIRKHVSPPLEQDNTSPVPTFWMTRSRLPGTLVNMEALSPSCQYPIFFKCTMRSVI